MERTPISRESFLNPGSTYEGTIEFTDYSGPLLFESGRAHTITLKIDRRNRNDQLQSVTGSISTDGDHREISVTGYNNSETHRLRLDLHKGVLQLEFLCRGTSANQPVILNTVHPADDSRERDRVNCSICLIKTVSLPT